VDSCRYGKRLEDSLRVAVKGSFWERQSFPSLGMNGRI